MTTKYQRPSDGFDGDGALPNRSKYQNDAAATPPVPISSRKVDGDINYLIAAVNEIDEASGSRSSIADRLNISFNADGTLRSSANLTLDDWVQYSASNLQRVDDTTVRIDGDETSIFTPHRRVRLTVNGSDVFANIASISVSGNVSTISLTGLTNASGEFTTVSQTPTAISYSPVITGDAGNTPISSNNYTLRGETPALRVSDVGASEFAVRVNGAQMEFVENTGTEQAPVWTVRGSVSASGIAGSVLADGSVTTSKIVNDAVTLSKLASGTAGYVVGFDGSGNPTELDISLGAGDVTSTVIASSAVTASKIAASAVTSTKLASNSVLEASLASNSVSSSKIASNAVNEAKIASNAVTSSKIASSAVTTDKINNDAVTLAKLASGTPGKYIGFDGSGNPTELSVAATSTATTTAEGVVEKATAAEVLAGTSSSVYAAVADMKAHQGVCKAWVNFQGNGTVTVNDSYNVTSVTDLGTGRYRVNWGTDFSSTNYAAVAMSKATSGDDGVWVGQLSTSTTATSYFEFGTMDQSTNLYDGASVSVIAFGEQ